MENTVELIGTYGGDETHALSAWTSTSRELGEEKRARIGKILKTLADEGHGTPFEKSSIHFLVTCDIATHIQILKHRIGVSVNAESARYKELKDDKFYLPTDWEFHHGPDSAQATLYEWFVRLECHAEDCASEYHQCLEALTPILGRKRAKESARYFLPYANQLTQDVMFNFRSFHTFLSLRKKPEAQLEIRELATKMLDAVKATGEFDLTLAAFGY